MGWKWVWPRDLINWWAQNCSGTLWVCITPLRGRRAAVWWSYSFLRPHTPILCVAWTHETTWLSPKINNVDSFYMTRCHSWMVTQCPLDSHSWSHLLNTNYQRIRWQTTVLKESALSVGKLVILVKTVWSILKLVHQWTSILLVPLSKATMVTHD